MSSKSKADHKTAADDDLQWKARMEASIAEHAESNLELKASNAEILAAVAALQQTLMASKDANTEPRVHHSRTRILAPAAADAELSVNRIADVPIGMVVASPKYFEGKLESLSIYKVWQFVKDFEEHRRRYDSRNLCMSRYVTMTILEHRLKIFNANPSNEEFLEALAVHFRGDKSTFVDFLDHIEQIPLTGSVQAGKEDYDQALQTLDQFSDYLARVNHMYEFLVDMLGESAIPLASKNNDIYMVTTVWQVVQSKLKHKSYTVFKALQPEIAKYTKHEWPIMVRALESGMKVLRGKFMDGRHIFKLFQVQSARHESKMPMAGSLAAKPRSLNAISNSDSEQVEQSGSEDEQDEGLGTNLDIAASCNISDLNAVDNTQVCFKMFRHNKCDSGTSCKFSHKPQDLLDELAKLTANKYLWQGK